MTAFPSEASVLVSKYQQITSVDLTDTSTIAQATTDNVVETFLAAGQGYTGLAVAANADGKGVTVGTAGSTTDILYNLGGGYPLRSPAVIDLTPQINAIPDATSSQIVLIVASGGTTQAQESRTLEDASLKPTNPADLWPTVQQVLTTRIVRACTPDIVPGVSAVAPQPPAYNPLLCLLATVTLNKTGVVSVVQNAAARITRLDQLAPLVASQGIQLSSYQQVIAGLLSSVASLSAGLASQQASFAAQLAALQQQIAGLESRQVTTTTSSILTITDYFNDMTGLRPGDGTGYGVGGGLTFPQSNKNPITYFPLTAVASNVKVLGNRYMTLPYTEEVVNLHNLGGEINDQAYFYMSDQGSWNVSASQEGFGVSRTRYGASYGAQPAAQLLASGSPSALFGINAGDIVYDPNWGSWTNYSPELTHLNGYWHDLSARGYWGTRSALPGTGLSFVVSTAIINPFDDMITGISFIAREPGAGARLLVCEDYSGNPDPTRVLMDVSSTIAVPREGDAPTITFTFPHPLFRPGGKRLHFVILTASANFVLYVCPGMSWSGTPAAVMLLRTVNGWQQDGRATVPNFTLKRAVFTAASPVELNLLYLGGGIDAVDLLAPAIVPPGCDIRYGTIPAGSTAYTRFAAINPNDASSNLLAGRPTQLRLFVEMSTTRYTAPVIDLQASVSGNAGTVPARQSGTLTAESAIRVPPAPVTKITRQVFLSGFNPALHTYTEVLETGAVYATLTNPTSTGAPAAQADGTMLLTFSWTLAAAVPSFGLKYAGTTSDTTQQFTMPKSITTMTP